MDGFERAQRYADRSVCPAGLVEHDGWRFKQYDVHSADRQRVDAAHYALGWAKARARLPAPAVTRHRPGVGVIIRHAGVGADYLVLCWWDNQNELIQHLQVCPQGSDAWVCGDGRFSVCVWDLEVIGHERGAFVRHVLGPESGPDIQGYLDDVLAARVVRGA